MADELQEKLAKLKQWLEQGLITEQDYQTQKEVLLHAYLGITGTTPTPKRDPFEDAANSFHPRRATLLTDLKPDLVIGHSDSRFRLVREIGGGGMGRVWLARDLEEEALEGGERYKALKVVHPGLQDSPRALKDLKREAAWASRLAHPNIINVYGHRQGPDGWLFVVMDYLEGRDLDRLLYEEGKPGMGWKRTLELLQPMVAALDYAHRQRLLHRDLKPGNVFITKTGEVKLLDFGLAYRLHRSVSVVNIQEATSGGVPEYMPPEAFVAGQPNAAQDIYALACMIYEMLAGEPPYSPEAARMRPSDVYPARPEGLTEAAWAVLKSGFAYHKETRPGSAGELLRKLQAAQVVILSSPTLPSIQNIHGWSAERVKALQQQVAEALGKPVVFRDQLKDGGEGPEMVVIPAGEFLMGSPGSEEGREDNERQHPVTIKQPFAIGKYVVTFAEYDRFVDASGREKPNDRGWGRDDRPVINVSWEDAVAYAEWLSKQTDERYRLPTESEWEYAARAGTTTPFHFGATISTEQANYDGNFVYGNGVKGTYRGKTVPVGQFPGNAWGLHDVHGNVWEWSCSEYKADYDGAEQECISKNNASALRVLRGGSWNLKPQRLRAASRYRFTPANRVNYWGFRLARKL